jgi:ribA/ribD-fused uncharacterized protein
MNYVIIFWIIIVVGIILFLLFMSSSSTFPVIINQPIFNQPKITYPIVKERWARCTKEMLDSPNYVKGFCGRHAFLSNFYMHPIVRNGIRYGSSEAAYQAAKYDGRPAIQQLFISVTPDQSKKLADAYPYNVGAFKRKEVMKQVLEAKFSDPGLRSLLLSTGQKRLEEYNWWGDTYWGVTRTGGENQLGIMLMELRERLR